MALRLWTDFFDDLQNVRGRSRNTVMAYRRDLELYERFCLKYSENDFERLYSYMKEQGLSTRSQARVISSLRTYFRFLDEHGESIPDLRTLKPPKVSTKLPEPLTMEEFEKLFMACQVDDPFRTARNQVTLLLLFGLGCRVTELTDLNLADFNETEGWLTVLGKGGKERVVPLTTKLLRELTDYLKDVRPKLLKGPSSTILVNDRGKRPSRVDVWRWLAAWSKKAGFEATIGPHRFRHGCATQLLEAGADLRSIQVLLGHSSIQTTQIYASVSRRGMQETIQQNHPLSEIDEERPVDPLPEKTSDLI